MKRRTFGFLGVIALPLALPRPMLAADVTNFSDANLSQRVLPAVVTITVEKIVHEPKDAGRGRRILRSRAIRHANSACRIGWRRTAKTYGADYRTASISTSAVTRMAKGVDAALRRLAMTESRLNEDQVRDRIIALARQGRYLRDVY